jgi:hypothetical protein
MFRKNLAKKRKRKRKRRRRRLLYQIKSNEHLLGKNPEPNKA